MEVKISPSMFSRNNGYDLSIAKTDHAFVQSDLSEEDLAAIAIAIIDYLVEVSRR